MERYLLFDAQCQTCARMAAEIRRGRVQVSTRPLGDLDVQAWLQCARPRWRWEPTLLEIEHGIRVRAATGARMRIRLVRLLGIRRAWTLWRRAQKLPPAHARPDRRDAELLEAVGAVLMSPEFTTIRPRLASTCPQDAWHEPEFQRYVIVLTIVSRRAHERLAAFTVTDGPPPLRVIGVSEIRVEATGDGWRAANVAIGARSTPVDTRGESTAAQLAASGGGMK